MLQNRSVQPVTKVQKKDKHVINTKCHEIKIPMVNNMQSALILLELCPRHPFVYAIMHHLLTYIL